MDRARLTVLFVTHDVREAVRLADRVLVSPAGPGGWHEFPVDIPRPRGGAIPAAAALVADITSRLRDGGGPPCH